MNDPYQVLGVERDATQEEIQKAYRKKSFELHPDLNGGDDGPMADLNWSYECLGSVEARDYWDKNGCQLPLKIEWHPDEDSDRVMDMAADLFEKMISNEPTGIPNRMRVVIGAELNDLKSGMMKLNSEFQRLDRIRNGVRGKLSKVIAKRMKRRMDALESEREDFKKRIETLVEIIESIKDLEVR